MNLETWEDFLRCYLVLHSGSKASKLILEWTRFNNFRETILHNILEYKTEINNKFKLKSGESKLFTHVVSKCFKM